MLVENEMDRPVLSAREYPHYVKYMGSKSAIMDFVLEGINSVYSGGAVCDLFAGSASLSGAIGHLVPVHSNDIQAYSGVLAQTYLQSYKYNGMPTSDDLLTAAEAIVREKYPMLAAVIVDYKQDFSLEEFADVERAQQKLMDNQFQDAWHLFTKYYSGTWWSTEQCLWIDAIRQVAERFRQSPAYSLILSSLMYAMAYTSQGTGHYAQYRDAKTESSLKDIVIYRRRDVCSYFRRKYDDVSSALSEQASTFSHKTTTLDFKDCLKNFAGGTIYADPPYCFVHYSRFYHAIETLVLYDYPEIQHKGGKVVKGRYREGRHQSPFCIGTQVKQAFKDLFLGVMASGSSLVLSYSNTGMISPGEIEQLIEESCPNRTIEIVLTNHQHMTLGRQNDRHRDVEECLFLIK